MIKFQQLGHSDQFGQRFSAQLSHAVAAMHLDGNLADTSSPAICLFIKPPLTNVITSSSRGVTVLKRACSSATGLLPRACPDPIAARVAPHRAALGHERGLVRNSTAPAFMALTVMGMSPWPVMKMME